MKYLILFLLTGLIATSCDQSNKETDVGKVNVCETKFNTINKNNWDINIGSDGSWGYSGGANGGKFPKDSSSYPLAGLGIFIGAIKNSTPSVSWVQFQSEYRPGIILNSQPASIGNLTYSQTPTSCIYTIDASHSGYGWENWPIAYGAPVDNANNPLLISSQDSWTVYHDIDSSKHMYSTNPILGVEVRQSTYMFTDNLYSGTSDVVFIRFKVTNKSNNNYTGVYVGLWGDIDLGAASNNLVGSDSSKSMVYMYNASSTSNINLGYAIGCQLLYSTDLGGLNVKPQASIWYKKSIDENGNDEEQYNLLKGLNKDGSVRTTADISRPTIDFPGDPVSGTGLLDTTPVDKRMLISTGSINLNSGASKEFVFALIGGQGSDRLQAITNLKTRATNIKNVFATQISGLLALN